MYYFNAILNEKIDEFRNFLGIILIVVPMVGFYGWIGSNETECLYITELFEQYRYCENAYEVAMEKPMNFITPIFCFVILVGGMLLLKAGNRKRKKHVNQKT